MSNYSMVVWFLVFLSSLPTCYPRTGQSQNESPCFNVINVTNALRQPKRLNSIDTVELCDSDLSPEMWYNLGGEITNACVELNFCSTYSGIWYFSGVYPTGDEIVTGTVCSKIESASCCGWTGTIKIKKCPSGYIYQLAIPETCPMSYCVGEPIKCSLNEVFDRQEKRCLKIQTLDKPTLGEPYISAYKMYDSFNATAFSIDCILKSSNNVVIERKLKVEVIFRMNEMEVAKFEVDYPVDKVSMEESYLKGHIGKTLTCEAQLFYAYEDGTTSTRTNLVRSDGFYFGINAVNSAGILKEIQIQQGNVAEIFLQSTFPITFGHCVHSNQCTVRKYSFVTKENKVSQNYCQIQFENSLGFPVYKSATSIKISALVTMGIENTRDLLAFRAYTHLSKVPIFEGFIIASLPVIVAENKQQPTCQTIGDPHILSFSGAYFHNYLAGDFNLLSSKHRSLQIQIRQIPCFKTVACNCGVIAREGNNLVGINSCDYRKTPYIIDLMKDNVNPSANIQKTNNDYLIQFVSGISIKVNFFFDHVKQATYLNIYVNGLKHEEYDGMCASKTKPDFQSLRIPYDQSFFKGQLPSCVNEVYNFPACKCVGNDLGEVNVICSYDKPNSDTNVVRFENICDLKKRRKRSTGNKNVPIIISEKDTTNKLTLEDIFVDIYRETDNQVVIETINMPLDEAQGHCTGTMKLSKFFDKCQEFLNDKYESLYQSCIADVQLSGNGKVAETYLNIIEEVCMTSLNKEISIVDGEKSPESTKVVNLLDDMNNTFSERQANASTPWVKEETPDITMLDKPVLSAPYISAYKMYGTFNATAFSIDCILKSNKIQVEAVDHGMKIKMEVLFRMNEMEVAKFEVDYPVEKVTLEESYLKKHIGKTLTCEARLFYSIDGSSLAKSDAIKSESYYFGVRVVDTSGRTLKEIQIQQSVTVEIFLQTTFPITFGHCVYSDKCDLRKYSFTTKENKVSQNDCQIQFENPTGELVYKSKTSIKISAKVTLGIEKNTQITLAFNSYTHVHKVSIFEGFTISSIEVKVVDTNPQPTCHSIGDPHIVSFSGLSFNNYFTGDFNLLSTNHRSFQIQVRQIPCFSGTISCNCGLIVREENNLVGINSCDYRKTPLIIDFMRDNLNPSASIQKINNDYLIQFMSGISIKVNFFFDPAIKATYLNIYVNALKNEEYEGMCTADDNPDLNSYKIIHEQSFFRGQLPPCVNEAYNFTVCKCIGKEEGHVSVVCDHDQSKTAVGVTKFDNICDLEKWKDGADVLRITSEKDTTNSLTLDDIFKTVNNTNDNQVVIEIKKMSLEEAQDHCSSALRHSKHFDKCQEILGEKFESTQQSCIADVQLSGDSAVTIIYLNIFEEICKTTLGKTVVMTNGEPSPESNQAIILLGNMNDTFNEREANSSTPWTEEEKTNQKSDIPVIERVTLSDPYISAYKMYDTFNATAFSIDCIIKYDRVVPVEFKIKPHMTVIFQINDVEFASIEFDHPVEKASLEESYLKGHIGKKLTCQAHLTDYYDGTTKTQITRSNEYYFNIDVVDSTGSVVKELPIRHGVHVDIYLQSTFPITFAHCVYSECSLRKYAFKTKENKLRQDSCEVQFENPFGLLVYKSSTIKISAQMRPGIEHTRDLLTFYFDTLASNVSIFGDLIIVQVQVTIMEDKQQPSCYTLGDPHILSFSGAHLHNYLTGDFNLLSTKHRIFQIQVRQIPCSAGTVTCNCGVIVREGNNLIGISSCDYRKIPLIIYLMSDNVNPSASIQKINNEYVIQLLSGISIKVHYFFDPVRQATFLNIFANGLKHEEYEGMCAAASTPDLNTLRIPLADSFFKEQLPSCVNEVYNTSVCKCLGDGGRVSVVCDHVQPIKIDEVVEFGYLCDVKKERSKEEKNVILLTPSRDINSLTLEEVFKTINRTIDEQTVTETINMPLVEAQGHCDKVLRLSKYFDKCQELLKDKFESIKQSCIPDVQLSGKAELAQIYLNIFEEVCMTTLGKEVVITDGEPSPGSNEFVEMLGNMTDTFAKRQANASTPWAEEVQLSDLIQWIKDLKPGHVIIFSGTFLLIAGAIIKF